MQIALAYHDCIDRIVTALGTDHATMHVHVGLALYLLAQIAMRDRRGSMMALHVVFAAEMANELMDWLAKGTVDWQDAGLDILLTMMWPVAITLVSQYRRVRWRRVMQRRAQQQALHARMHMRNA